MIQRAASVARWVSLIIAFSVFVQSSSGQSIDKAALNKAKRMLHTAIDDGKFAGAAHLVWKDGKQLHFEVAGLRDIEANAAQQPDTIMAIASMTKPVTAVAAMILYDRGKFQLDDPVSQFIPAFANSEVIVEDGENFKHVPANRQITIRDVLSHSTGISYGEGNDNYSRVSEYAAKFYKFPPSGFFFPDLTIKDFADRLARIPLIHQPGEEFTYGWNIDLLGRLIEMWSGQPLDEFMRESLFEPLAMNDTSFVVPAEKRDRYASMNGRNEEGKLNVINDSAWFFNRQKFVAGGGGLVTTMPDFSKFCEMLMEQGQLNGRRVLKPETVKLIFAKHVEVRDEDGGHIGLGISVRPIELGKTGRKGTVHGWKGASCASFNVVPQERYFQIFMGHMAADEFEFIDELFATVNEGVQ